MKENTVKRKGKLAQIIGNKRCNEGTLIVSISYSRKNPKYKKIENFKTRLQVHYSEKKSIPIGTKVYIVNCKPYSKTKTWKIQSVLLGENLNAN